MNNDATAAATLALGRILTEVVNALAAREKDPETFIAQMKVDITGWADGQEGWTELARSAFDSRLEDVLGSAQNRNVGG